MEEIRYKESLRELVISGPSPRVRLLTQERCKDRVSCGRGIGRLRGLKHYQKETVVILGCQTTDRPSHQIGIDRPRRHMSLLKRNGVVRVKVEQQRPGSCCLRRLHAIEKLASRISQRQRSKFVHPIGVVTDATNNG